MSNELCTFAVNTGKKINANEQCVFCGAPLTSHLNKWDTPAGYACDDCEEHYNEWVDSD